MMHQLWIALVTSLFCLAPFACNTNKSANGSQTCKTQGVVQDFTGTDGCSLLIITEDGKKLLPGKVLNSQFQLEAGQKIRFDYRPIDMMSICMAEDQIVEITCIELLP